MSTGKAAGYRRRRRPRRRSISPKRLEVLSYAGAAARVRHVRLERGRQRGRARRRNRRSLGRARRLGLDSLIEIVASAVVVWQLKGTAKARERQALQMLGTAFVALALYIAAQSIYVLAAELRPHHSQVGIEWLALTALVMFALAWGKSRTGSALGNRVLQTKAPITVIDGVLAPSRSSSALSSMPPSAGGGPTQPPPSSSSTSAHAKAEPHSPKRCDRSAPIKRSIRHLP